MPYTDQRARKDSTEGAGRRPKARIATGEGAGRSLPKKPQRLNALRTHEGAGR